MATNFGFEATQASEIPSAQTPKEGIVKQPVLLQGLGTVFEQATNLLINKKKTAQQQTLSDFTSKQLLVADALAQGKIRSSAHAQTLMRRNLLDAIEANPGLTADLIEAQKAITGLPGGAKIVDEGTEEEQRRNKLADTLVQNGLIDPDATDEEINHGITEFQQLEAFTRQHTLRMQTLDEQLKVDTLTNSQRKALEDQKRTEAENYALKVAPMEFKRVKNEFQKILEGPGTESDKLIALQDMYAEFKSQSTDIVSSLDSQRTDALIKPFEMLFEQYSQRITGEITDDELKRNNDRMTAVQTNLALQDPTIARLAVTSKLFGDAGFQQVIMKSDPKVVEAFLNYVAGTTPGQGVPPPSPYTDKMSEREGLKEGLNAITRGVMSSDPELAEEATQRLQLVLESAEDYEGLLRRNPKAGIEFVEWMSSSQFLAAQKAHPELFTNLDSVKDILGRHYSDEVWGMVQREFTDNKIVIPQTYFSGSDFAPPSENTTMSTKDVVSIRSIEGGMEFFTESNDRLIKDKVRELNKELKPIINTTVKAMAHLEGSSNYKQTWENVATDFLQGAGTTDTDPEDDLSLDSFRTPTSALDDALITGGFVGTGDYTNAETPEEVAASFIGFTETEHKDVLSSFIRKTIGTNINPESTAWCAAFVNAALGATGKSGTKTLLARDFLNWGQAVDTPTKGDLVVFERGNSTWQGHVGFYVGQSKNGNLLVLGGNQDNKVSIKEFSPSKVLGYRRG